MWKGLSYQKRYHDKDTSASCDWSAWAASVFSVSDADRVIENEDSRVLQE